MQLITVAVRVGMISSSICKGLSAGSRVEALQLVRGWEEACGMSGSGYMHPMLPVGSLRVTPLMPDTHAVTCSRLRTSVVEAGWPGTSTS